MVLGGVGWDRKEFPESNLHVCGRDDTKIVVYSMGRCTRKGGGEKKSKTFSIRLWTLVKTIEKTRQYNINSSSHFEDRLSYLTCV